MALKLNERYPGRTDPASIDYPQGSFKNRSSPTAKDGTYLEKDWANDDQGFKQSLLSAAGVTANGQVDKVGASQYFDALKKVIENESPKSTQPIQGSFKKLKLSASGSSSLVSITSEQLILENPSLETRKLFNVNLSINTASVGLNGLDTGALVANTWYSVWVISDGVNVRGLISLSATAPSMPNGYTHKARIGWIRTDPSSNKFPLSFVQNGASVQYKLSSGSNLTGTPVIASGVMGNPQTPTWVECSVSNFVPATAKSISCTIYVQGVGLGVCAAPNNSYGGYTSRVALAPLSLTSMAGASSENKNSSATMLLESSSIYYASNDSLGVLAIYGWEDSL